MRNVPGSGANGGLRSSAWFDRNDPDGILRRAPHTGVSGASYGAVVLHAASI
jgi:hypothetical protein